MREIATILPIVKTSGTHYLTSPITDSSDIDLKEPIDVRVVFNPYAANHAWYGVDHALWYKPSRLSGKTWALGSRAIAKSEHVTFDTFDTQDLETLTAQRRSNFGMWLPIKPHTVAYEWEHKERKGWGTEPVRVWQVKGTTQVREMELNVDAVFKAPNGGGILQLYLPSGYDA